MQQQHNNVYPFLYQRHTCHQIQPNQATYFFFLKDPPPPEIYPLPLHDALPIFTRAEREPLDAISLVLAGGEHDHAELLLSPPAPQLREHVVSRGAREETKELGVIVLTARKD